jgi:hypothetical protein
MSSRPHNLSTRVSDVIGPRVAARTSGTVVREWPRDERRPGATWQSAERRERRRFSSCAVRRPHSHQNRRGVRGIATWLRSAGPPVTVTVAVAMMHLALLLWIFLRIGG